MQNSYYENLRLIDSIIESRNFDAKLLDFIKEEKYRNYFFAQDIPIQWFDILEEKKYFDAKTVPFDIRYWAPLDYFTKLAEQIKKDGDVDGVCLKLLNVIKSVTEFRNEDGKSIDNYFVWHAFSEVLNGMPNKMLRQFLTDNETDFSDWLSVWVSSTYDTSVVARDLSEQLLPKFISDDPDDIKIAEKIVLCLLEIHFKANEEFGKSSMKKKAVLTVKDTYFITEGLLKRGAAKKLGEKCSQTFISALMQRLNVVLQYEHFSTDDDLIEVEGREGWRIRLFRRENEQGQIVDGRYHVKFYKIEGKEYKEFVKKSYWDSAYWDAGNVVWEDNTIKDCFDADQFANDVFDKIKSVDEVQIVNNNIKARLVNLFEGLNYDLTHVSFESLEKDSQLYIRKARDILIMVLRDILLGKAVDIQKSPSAKKDFEGVLTDFVIRKYPFPVFNRILLIILKYHFDELNPFFWKLLELNPGIFYLPACDIELHACLKKNAQKFHEPAIKEKLKKAILFQPEKIKKDLEGDYILRYQQGYFEALSENTFFSELAVDWQKKTKTEKIPQRAKRSMTWSGNGQSFVTVDQFLNNNTQNNDIVDLIESLQNEDRLGPTQRTVEATADELEKAVKQKPEKFYADLTPFLGVKFTFVNALLKGFRSSMEEQKLLDWDNIFDFILRYFETDYFRNNEKDEYSKHFTEAHRSWVVSSVAELIRSASQNDDWERPVGYFEKSAKVFNKLFEVWEGVRPKKADIQEVINTSRGRVIEAYIIFSLQRARINDKKKEDKAFHPEIFDAWFKDHVPEAYTLFGRYLPNMMFMNEGWMFDKLKEFKGLDKEEIYWKGFFQGYVWSSGLYKKIFQAMIQHKHYQTAIETKLDYEQVQRQIVDHAGFSFVVGFKNQELDNPESLIRILLDSYDYETYCLLIDSFWGRAREVVEKTEEKEENKKYLDKIKEFWSWVFSRDDLQKRFGENYENVLAHLSLLICIFDTLEENDVFEQVKKIAPYVDRHRDSAFFVEYLNKFKDKHDVEKVGEIYLEMLKATLPDYKREDIQSIVKKLYHYGFNDSADKICEIYGSNSIHFLRELWEENNSMEK